MEVKQVHAVGVAAGAHLLPHEHNNLIATMQAAVLKAQGEGITDQDEIRRRILAARDSVGS